MLRRIFSVLLLTAASLAAHAQDKVAAEVEVVARLYRDFAWEAVIDQPAKGRISFIEQSIRDLQRYLEPGLAALLRADRACVSRSKEFCKLDFDPIWASQDPGATELKIKAGAKNGVVEVSFVHPGSGQRIQLQYEVARTAAGPRIYDIRYEDGSTLRAILQGKL